jgi:alpha-amylase/alpha-mannosidase (GH57 family)
MAADSKLDLVLMWHMHQPDYRDHGTRDRPGEFVLPWVYLHAIKDYSDMAAHLERHPRIRAVVNFVPVLVEQIQDYVAQFETGVLRDPLLRLLARPDYTALDEAERKLILDSCFRNNHVTMLQPFPRYKRLHDLVKSLQSQGEGALRYLSGDFYSDLITWYHLVWFGEAERRREPVLVEMLSKGEGFDFGDRRRVFDLVGALLKQILPRYRALASAGRIEISATPYSHPLAPLLINLKAAREALPETPLPHAAAYPGGRQRVAAQIELALAHHAQNFGSPAQGMWPAEGALSDALLGLMSAQGVHWAASSEGVLANSLKQAGALPPRPQYVYRPYRVGDLQAMTLFFRDEKLSDLIGFEYAKWHGRDAAAHFVAQLEAIRHNAPAGETPLVCVILDGENAWEYYPYNAYYFFEDLYTALAANPAIRSTTFSEYLARDCARPGHLPRLVAGSWVYGTLSTWIGDADKNRAWDLLCAAKQSFDLVMASDRLDAAERRAAEEQLAVCESSDWFWWFGDYNPQHVVQSFDHLYRLNLRRLYELIRLPIPAALDQPLGQGHGSPESGGTMRRAS